MKLQKKIGIPFNSFVRYAKEFDCYKPNQGEKGWKIPKNKHTKDEFVQKVLIENGPKISTSRLKDKLYEFKLKEDICEVCGQSPWWNGKQIVLHIDHIDGNRRNNNLNNLRIICPHCHTQTITYAGKNKNKYALLTQQAEVSDSKSECSGFESQVE